MIGLRPYKDSKANTLQETSRGLGSATQVKPSSLPAKQSLTAVPWRRTELAVHDMKVFKTLVTEVAMTTP